MSKEQKKTTAKKTTAKKTFKNAATAKQSNVTELKTAAPKAPPTDAEKENLKKELAYYKNKVIAQQQYIGELYTELKSEQMKVRMLQGPQS